MSIRINSNTTSIKSSNVLSLNQVLSVGMYRRPPSSPIPAKRPRVYEDKDDPMDASEDPSMSVEELKTLLTDLPVGIREKIVLESLSELDAVDACRRVDELCGGQLDNLTRRLCESQSFFALLCEQLGWFGPFRNWAEFVTALLDGRVFSVDYLYEPSTLTEDNRTIVTDVEVVYLDAAMTNNTPMEWFRYMCERRKNEFGSSQDLRFDSDTDFLNFSQYFGKSYGREWICNFNYVSARTDLLTEVVVNDNIRGMQILTSVEDIQQRYTGGFVDTNALAVAIENNKREMAMLLLQIPNINPNFVYKGRYNRHMLPLGAVIAKGDTELFDMLLQHPNIDVNALPLMMASSLTPLGTCVDFRRLDMARKLLARSDVDVNKRWTNDSISPFNLALMIRRADIRLEFVKLLISHPNIDLNSYGRRLSCNDGDMKLATPLLYAIYLNQVDVIKILLADRRLDVNESAGYKFTPLGYAVKKRSDVPEIAKLLRDAGGRMSQNPVMNAALNTCPISETMSDQYGLDDGMIC